MPPLKLLFKPGIFSRGWICTLHGNTVLSYSGHGNWRVNYPVCAQSSKRDAQQTCLLCMNVRRCHTNAKIFFSPLTSCSFTLWVGFKEPQPQFSFTVLSFRWSCIGTFHATLHKFCMNCREDEWFETLWGDLELVVDKFRRWAANGSKWGKLTETS